MNTIKYVAWASQMGAPSTIGIVVMNNGFETKCYVGTASGYDEDKDIEHIVSTGGKITAYMLERLLEAMK